MMTLVTRKIQMLILGYAVLTVSALAQSGGAYNLDWFSIDGGGVAGSGGDYSLESTMGQPDPGPMMSGGGYTIIGGFRAAVCVPDTGIGGSGTEADPYRISNINDLFDMMESPENWANYFILTADIDLAGITFTQAVIAPDIDVATSDFQGTTFNGVFDGNGHVIRNLTIHSSGREFVGLFGFLHGQIKNLGLENVTIQGGLKQIGGLLGYNSHGSITSCYTTGSVNAEGDNIGGLVGGNNGTNGGSIITCYSKASVSGSNNVGGLAGGASGTITNCYTTGEVNGNAGSTGGLLGAYTFTTGTITSCFWDTETGGQATSAGGTEVQGKTTAEMKTLSTFTNAGWDFTTVWYLPYDSYPRLRWDIPYSGGSGTEADPYQISSIDDLYDMMGLPEDWDWPNHFILTADIDLAGITFTQALIAPDMDPVTGHFQGTPFIGVFDGRGHVIKNLTIAGSSHDFLGFVGFLHGQIKNLGIENVDIQEGRDYVGGLAGLNNGTITSCYATGSVIGYTIVGGLVGANHGTTISSYARDTVGGNSYVGGLVGGNWQGKVIRSYSTGRVTGATIVGGLSGNEGTGGQFEDTGNFWDTETSGIATSFMGIGKTTAEMKTLSTFTNADWDFTTVWYLPYDSYPRLRWDIPYSGGSGTEADPYQISSIDDLYDMMGSPEDWNWPNQFILTADIDLAGITFTRSLIAPDTDVVTSDFQGTPFVGVFDGNGHVIRNLTITGANREFIGFFGFLHGQIKNLGIENIDIQGGRERVGGLLGYNSHGSITSCYTTGSVNAEGDNVGGLVGDNNGTNGGSIITCYSKASVSGSNNVGGLAGGASGTITNCYATGAVNGNAGSTGGLLGAYTFTTGTITSCFWDTETGGQATSAGGTEVQGKTTTEMKTLLTFTSAGWDFIGETVNGTADIWTMRCAGMNYPKLTWQQVPTGDFVCPDGVNTEDLDYFVGQWLATNCTAGNGYCGQRDINNSGIVDIADFAILAQYWLE